MPGPLGHATCWATRFGFVIVRVAIDYRRELSLEDEAVVVDLPGHRVRDLVDPDAPSRSCTRDGTLAAEAESVVVKHDDRRARGGAADGRGAGRCSTRRSRADGAG